MQGSSRDQKSFGEGPFGVYPLSLAAKTGPLRKRVHLSEGILVAGLRPDSLAFTERDGEAGKADGYALDPRRTQVHLDAPGFGIEESDVLESIEPKISMEFGIDSRQQIQIESGSYPERIVVRADQPIRGFFEVGSQKQRVSGIQEATNVLQKYKIGRTVEIADRTAQEQQQDALPGAAAGGYFGEAVEILAFKADDADAIDVGQVPAANSESGGRNLDWVVRGVTTSAEGLQDLPCLASVAASEFRDNGIAGQAICDLMGAPL